ncbi:hypothetical protein MPH_07182 [Macrophomina phaseolina MS6]|uniref:Uncharacterized protein n=1 Tax=Macrophomina phaseolina (strain MS6) TaxID=1126212 RepID=K2RSP2_MACPH|nr:hypothetical protein MPH_07182 [Macrophomina phaseolina MS6]
MIRDNSRTHSVDADGREIAFRVKQNQGLRRKHKNNTPVEPKRPKRFICWLSKSLDSLSERLANVRAGSRRTISQGFDLLDFPPECSGIGTLERMQQTCRSFCLIREVAATGAKDRKSIVRFSAQLGYAKRNIACCLNGVWGGEAARSR